MTKWYSAMPLRWKLASVSVLATVLVLAISGIAMAIYDIRAYERQKIDEVTGEAQILASSVVASLIFEDPQATSEFLKALGANQNITDAAVYDDSGRLIARYSKAAADEAQRIPPHAEVAGYRFESNGLNLSLPVVSDGETIGTVYIRSEVETQASRAFRYALVLLIAAVSALGVILPISIRLHGVISNPIAELAAKNAVIEATFSSVDHGVIVVDSDMRITLANQGVLNSFNILGPGEPGSILGERMDELTKQRLEQTHASAEVREHELKQLKSRDKIRGEFELDSGRTIEYRQSPLPDGGFVRTYTDVTDERAIQDSLSKSRRRAEEAVKAKSQFLAAMSHEIRTPMNGVIGIVELLQATPLDAEQRQLVEIIRQSGVSLLDVINDILDYSKIEAGRMTVESVKFALGELVETTALTIGSQSKSKTLNVVCNVDPSLDWHVKGDPVRIRQIILNLMGNALKFTEHGTVSITVTAKNVTESKVEALFEVSDTGIGIDEEQQKKLFQAFSQADYSTTRKYGGTGLGLSISQNLIRLMSGQIGVTSRKGQGSTFWFTIPFEKITDTEVVSPFEAYEKTLSGLKVLLCDRVSKSSGLTRYLMAVGVQVIEAPNFTEVVDHLKVEAIAEKPVDLVILNVRLGEDSTSELIGQLERHRDLERTKLLFVLPHMSVSANRIKATKGVSSTIPAPVRRKQLYDSVAYLAERASPDMQVQEDTPLIEFSPPSVADAAASKCLILVAEDNATNQFVIRNQLQRLGYAAEFVGDGSEGWNAYRDGKEKFGLIITDCHMPYIDGYKLTGMIRDREQATGEHLPIVALTANALEGEREVCLAAGMDDYLFKPASLKLLDQMIQKWLPAAINLRRPAAKAQTQRNTVAVPIVKSSTPNPAIDISALKELIGVTDRQQIIEMLILFQETMADTPAELNKCIVSGDAVGLTRAAHAAKGAALSACATTFASLCKNLEAAGRSGDWGAIKKIHPQIQPAFQEVTGFITQYAQTGVEPAPELADARHG